MLLAFLLLYVVEAMVNFDSLQPVTKGRAALKAAQAEECPDKGFLSEVVGAAFVSCHESTVGHNSLLIFENQLFERAQIPICCPDRRSQEFFILFFLIRSMLARHLSRLYEYSTEKHRLCRSRHFQIRKGHIRGLAVHHRG
jgi:hypothetical protein